MCGLVGVMGALTHREKQAFKWLLNFDATRGEHSTGVLAVSPDNATHMFKELGTPAFLYQKYSQEFPKGVYEKLAKVLMGHNRFATQGEIVAENAHPFEFENVIGAHNGTIAEWNTKKLHMADAFKIDSQKLYSQLNHDADVQKLWDHLEDGQGSAASLTYWDKRDNSMNFVRNSQRPMHFAVTKDTQTLFWASEKWMLQVACANNGVQIQDIESSEINQHYRVTFKDAKLVVSKKAVEPKKWFVTYSSGAMGYGNIPKPATKFIDLRIDHIVQDGVQPTHIVMTKIGAQGKDEDVICVPPLAEVEETVSLVRKYFSLHKNVYEGDVTFLTDDSWLYTAQDNKTLRMGAYRLIREMKDGIDTLEWEVKNSDEPEEVSHAIAEDAKGNPISGRALKKALKAAGSCCAWCGSANLKRGDITTIHGGIFLNEKDFVCGECVADGVVYNMNHQN